MADETSGETNEEKTQPEEQHQPIVVDGQYTKDLSFEAPETPDIFSVMHEGAPDIKIDVDVRASKRGEFSYEVLLTIKAECKIADKVAFLCELVYGGKFTLHVPEDTLKPMLLIECPRLLFPFARNIVADCTRDGGFPPLMLNPIDFVTLYRQGMEQEGQKPVAH